MTIKRLNPEYGKTTTISGWTVERLPNGMVQCWKDYNNVALTYSAWGSLYEARIINSAGYPFTFSEKPSFRVELLTCSPGLIGFEYMYGSETNTPRVYVLRPNSASGATISFRAIAMGYTTDNIGI